MKGVSHLQFIELFPSILMSMIMIIMIIICLQLIRLIGLRTESSWKSEGEEEVDEAQRGGNGDGGGYDGDGGGCDGDGGGGGVDVGGDGCVGVGGDDVCCGDGVGGVGGDRGGGDVGDAPLLAIDECADDSDVGNCNNDSDHHDDHDDNFEEKQMITQGLHGCPYESQSEAELEETCLALSSSQVICCHSHDDLMTSHDNHDNLNDQP